MSSIPARPFGDIALSFSGGGFRAAAYGLGSLSYLHHAQILEPGEAETSLLSHVRFISSASGGSFASLTYAAYLYAGRPFAEGYHALRDFMLGELLVKQVVALLSDETVWQRHPTKQRNLINAFAIAYDEFFGEATPDPATLARFCNPGVLKHLREVCVNSTELTNGLSFRFQNPDGVSRRGLVGNFSLYLRPQELDTIGRIKLGDILAASSCFPLGFEPMLFPDDFAYPASGKVPALREEALRRALYSRDPVSEAAWLLRENPPEVAEPVDADELTPPAQPVTREPTPVSKELLALNENAEDEAQRENPQRETAGEALPGARAPTDPAKIPSFGLMDGGIDDNQGIQSLLLADRRLRERNKKGTKKGFDLIIACDVASPFLGNSYTKPDAPTGPAWERSVLNWHGVLLRTLKIGGGVGLVTVGVGAVLAGRPGWGLAGPGWVFATLGAVLLLLGIGGLWVNGRALRGIQTKLEGLEGKFGPVIRNYVQFLLRIPAGSLEQMLVARVKSSALLATSVFLKKIRSLSYELLFENNGWRNRRIASLIYELSQGYYPLTEARLRKNPDTWNFVKKKGLIPSPEIQKVAESARTMPTTLWFEARKDKTAAQQRDDIIATGQFTMCYNLLLHLNLLDDPQTHPLPPYLTDMQARLLDDWEKFQKNPHWKVRV